MAKKQMSFAEKAAKHKAQKDWKTVKYVKSERSDKTGSWRFNESYIQLASNENIDQALNRMEQEVQALAKEMASIEESTPKVDDKPETKVEEVAEVEVTKTADKIDTAIKTEKVQPEQPAK